MYRKCDAARGRGLAGGSTVACIGPRRRWEEAARREDVADGSSMGAGGSSSSAGASSPLSGPSAPAPGLTACCAHEPGDARS